MCTRYLSPDGAAVEAAWRIGASQPWRGVQVFPRQPGLFLRPGRQPGAADMVVGQFELIPPFARELPLAYATQNCRSEEMRSKPAFREAWRRGQRCIIPAASFDEPCWETGRNVWHRFSRVDGRPWGLVGLWSSWLDRSSGELHESMTMLTLNADSHPIMRRMHKPDPRRGPDAQDKRSVIAVEHADVEQWLHGSPTEAEALLRLPAPELFVVQAG